MALVLKRFEDEYFTMTVLAPCKIIVGVVEVGGPTPLHPGSARIFIDAPKAEVVIERPDMKKRPKHAS